MRDTARAQDDRDAMLDAVEREILLLKEARPHLEKRIDRATHMLTVHFADPHSGKIRVRVAEGKEPRFLIESATTPGKTYSVYPSSWSCSCEDYANGGGRVCKHVISAYLLWKAGKERLRCHASYSGWVYLTEQVIDRETGELIEATNVVPCRRCKLANEGPYMSDEEMRHWMEHSRWKFASTMPKHPHTYTLREWHSEETFLCVVQTIWDLGYDRAYLRRPWRSLDVGEYYVWVHTEPRPGMPAPLEKTKLVNRALRVQERLV